MPRIKLKQVDQIWRKSVSDAQTSFIRHCQLKNLAPYTVKYYKENLQFFLDSMPQVKFVDEINQELIDQFVCMLMDKGNRVTAINARLRAAFVFLRYCFEQEYTKGRRSFSISWQMHKQNCASSWLSEPPDPPCLDQRESA